MPGTLDPRPPSAAAPNRLRLGTRAQGPIPGSGANVGWERPASFEAERFWARVLKKTPSDCWPWTGCKTDRGYGIIRHRKPGTGNIRAHRLSWEIHKGAIPTGLQVNHQCDNRLCVNPDHLYLGTQRQNVGDERSRGRLKGTFGSGERNRAARLTAALVREIRCLAAKGTSLRVLAKKYGVSDSTIWLIVQRKTWRHVGDDSWWTLETA